MRDLLLYHWHCILPVIGIVGAMFFMRDKDSNRKRECEKGYEEQEKPN